MNKNEDRILFLEYLLSECKNEEDIEWVTELLFEMKSGRLD